MNKKKKQLNILRLIILIVIIFMVFNVGFEVFNTFANKHKISTAKIENEKLKSEAKELENRIVKLNDDKYIQSYVSGTLFSTDKGTTVYVIPKEEDKQD